MSILDAVICQIRNKIFVGFALAWCPCIKPAVFSFSDIHNGRTTEAP